jgi:enoyl-CoA hydratase
MPGALGMYLGLTGARLRAADVMYAGIGTHYVPPERLSELVDALLARPVDDCLAGFAADAGEPPLAEHRAAIDRCFAGATIEAILAALEVEGTEWAEATRATLATKSPTSLKVTVRQLRAGAALDFAAAMRLEYRLSQRFCADHDFAEGIRSVVIDKDNAPQWRPASLADVTEADVDAHFQPPPDGELLL